MTRTCITVSGPHPCKSRDPGPLGLSRHQTWSIESTHPPTYWTIPTCCLCHQPSCPVSPWRPPAKADQGWHSALHRTARQRPHRETTTTTADTTTTNPPPPPATTGARASIPLDELRRQKRRRRFAPFPAVRRLPSATSHGSGCLASERLIQAKARRIRRVFDFV